MYLSLSLSSMRNEKEKRMKPGCFDRRKHTQQRCSRPQNPSQCPFFSQSSPLVDTPTGDAFLASPAPSDILFPLRHTGVHVEPAIVAFDSCVQILRGARFCHCALNPVLKPDYSCLSRYVPYRYHIDSHIS
jgi:hypothetical protein